MNQDRKPPGEPLSLSRWSKRKLEAARAERSAPVQGAEGTEASRASVPGATSAMPAGASVETGATTPLAPPESLPPDADFSAYFALRDQASEPLRRAALRQVLRDPRFNVMDGLDVYIDDYTKPSPIPEDLLPAILRASGFLESPKPEDEATAKSAPASVPAASVQRAGSATVADGTQALPDVTAAAAVEPLQAPASPDAPAERPVPGSGEPTA